MDIIVFNQDELNRALMSGGKAICLCDNHYDIPAMADLSFLAVGNVTVSVDASEAECAKIGMRFLNFEPEYSRKSAAFVPLKYAGLSNSVMTSGGSFSGSYRLSGSYAGFGSYHFSGSYAGSGSYVFFSTYSGSFSASYSSSFRADFARDTGYMRVFGYGIDLI